VIPEIQIFSTALWCTAALVLLAFGWVGRRWFAPPRFTIARLPDRSTSNEQAFFITCWSHRPRTYEVQWTADDAKLASSVQVMWGRSSISGFLRVGAWVEIRHPARRVVNSLADCGASEMALIFRSQKATSSTPIPVHVRIAWPCGSRRRIRMAQSFPLIFGAEFSPDRKEKIASPQGENGNLETRVVRVEERCLELARRFSIPADSPAWVAGIRELEGRISLLEKRSAPLPQNPSPVMVAEKDIQRVWGKLEELQESLQGISARIEYLESQATQRIAEVSQFKRILQDSVDTALSCRTELPVLNNRLGEAESGIHQLQEDVSWLRWRAEQESVEELLQRLIEPMESNLCDLKRRCEALEALHDHTTQKLDDVEGAEKTPAITIAAAPENTVPPERQPTGTSPSSDPLQIFLEEAYILFDYSPSAVVLPPCEEYADRLKQFHVFLREQAAEQLELKWSKRFHVVHLKLDATHAVLNCGTLQTEKSRYEFQAGDQLCVAQNQLFKLFLGVQDDDGGWRIYLPPGPFNRTNNSGDYTRVMDIATIRSLSSFIKMVTNPAEFTDTEEGLVLTQKMTLDLSPVLL